jgi:outer membrane lipoprotein SlyB
MRTSSRFLPIAACAAVAALATGCATPTVVNVPAPAPGVAAVPVAPPATVPVVPPVAAIEFGRVANIQYFPGGTASSRINTPGAIVGGVAGAMGSASSGSRDAATVLGGAAGAATGSQAGTAPAVIDTAYRITIQTDSGAFRTYDVPATGDLRVGDRVRVENGVIYRS